MDRITLDSMNLECIVGILPSERIETQRMQLNLSLEIDLQTCAETGDLSHSVNYAVVSKAARFLAGEGKFWLIESLGLAICRVVLASPGPGQDSAQVKGCTVHIRKPDILEGRSVPGVELSRNAPLNIEERTEDGCVVQCLVQTGRDAAWRVLVPENGEYSPGLGAQCTVLWGPAEATEDRWISPGGPSGILVVKSD